MDNLGDKAVEIIDRWAWWQTALKDPSLIGTDKLPVHESEPQQGYYRCRVKSGDWQPVAIWFDEETGSWLGYRDGKEPRDVNELWTWACRNPVTFDAYEKALAGDGWDDEPKKVAGIGDNSGEADPFEALKIEYLGEVEQVTEFLKKPVKTQADADKMAIWKDRLSKIKSRAEALHKVEKQPFLDGGRAVDEKWRTLKEEPKDHIAKMQAHVKPFFDELKRAEAERQRRAAEEAAKARREAEEAARKANETDQQGTVEREAAKIAAEEAAARARQAEKEAEARKVSAGRTGARMGLRTEKVGVVTDYYKAAKALIDMKHADLLGVIDTLAKRAAKAKMPFDGMEIKEEEIVR